MKRSQSKKRAGIKFTEMTPTNCRRWPTRLWTSLKPCRGRRSRTNLLLGQPQIQITWIERHCALRLSVADMQPSLPPMGGQVASQVLEEARTLTWW